MKRHILLNPSNFWLWLILALAVSVAGNITTDLVKSPSSVELWWRLLGILVFVVVLWILLSRTVRRTISELIARQRRLIQLDIQTSVSAAKALIVFVSKAPGSSSALDAALHHAAGGLEVFWMITSQEASEEAERIGRELKAQYPKVDVHPVVCISDIYSIVEAKAEVENIRRKSMRRFKTEADIICDFTGLTKSMSAGMILACAPRQARLQYMHPNKFQPDGRADISAGSHAVEVKIAYQIEDEEEEGAP
jgi:CRISPR-associated protein (Cas_Cas02710)